MNVDDLPYLTRVRVPQKRSDVLHRERLVDFLHEQVECRLILVSAPAGYGKTTLLLDFAHSVEAAVCWYNLSEADKDLRVFLEYFVASVRQRFPTFGEKTLALLGRVTDLAKDLSSIVGILVNEMHDCIPEFFFVILDDYHYVDDSPLVNEALDLILYYLPANCHIVLSSRTLPKITLTRLAAQRLVAGLGTSDLRFTSQEIRDFMRNTFKVLLPETLAQKLVDSSEGWITAIVLSTYGLGRGMLETITRARKSGSPVFDFLADEVFEQQPSDLQSFLLESSVLRQFNAQRCAEVLGISNAPETLLTVEERNLFVTRSADGNWYQYHNLFAEYLQGRLKAGSPSRYYELNLLAGAVCQRHGEIDNALHHYSRAERYDRVVPLLEETGDEILNTGKLQTLQGWLKVIPAELMEASPVLMTFQARVLYQAGELDTALAHFSRAIAGFERQGDWPSVARAIAKRSSVLRLMGLRGEAADDLRQLLQMAGEDIEVEAEARKGLGIIRGIEGKFGESISELKRSLALYEKLGHTYQMAELNHALGMAHYSKADLSIAAEFYRRSLVLSEKTGDLGFAATTLNNMAMVSYRQGKYGEALETLREALDKVREAGYLRMEAHVLDSLGTVLQDAGELGEALKAYEGAVELARRVNETPLITQLLNQIGRTYVLRGELAKADRFIRQASLEPQGNIADAKSSDLEFSAGFLAFHRKEYRQAVIHLLRACKGFKAAGAQVELARAHYHLANSYLSLNNCDDAESQMRAVDQVVSSLRCESYLLADFRRCPAPLELAVSRGIGLGWVGGVRQQTRLPEKPLDAAPPTGEPAAEATKAQPCRVKVFALGNCMVIYDDRQIGDGDWSTQITKELFFYLVSHPRGARRDEILSTLWPDVSLAKASSNFHGTLYRLRRATSSDFLLHQGGRYFLDPAVDIWYDAEEFEGCVNGALSGGANSEEAAAHWEKAVNLYQGTFLAEFYSEWCEARRRRLEDRYLQALGGLARHCLQKGDFIASAAYCEKALAVDPYAEELHRQLLKVYEMAGDRPAAIRHYNRLVQMFKEDLGSEPEPETVAVFNSLLTEYNPGQRGKDHLSGKKGG